MILWARPMAKLYLQFTLGSIHSSVMRSSLMNNSEGSSWVVRVLGKVANYVVAPGARNQLWAKDVKFGEYYELDGIRGAASELGGG